MYDKEFHRRSRAKARSLREGLGRRPNLHAEGLEARTLLTTGALPQATLLAPARSLIGANVDLTVGFANAGTNPGYGPYVDLFLPATGDDGKGSAATDGLSFVGASDLGQSVTSTVLTFDAAGHATHPYAVNSSNQHLVVSGTPGDKLVVLQLPFGSYTPGQPPASIDVTARLSGTAPLGTPLNVQARGGFRYGNDALDDPASDPSIVGNSTNAPVDPTLYLLKETYSGPEDETATGPNFPRTETLTVDVANGQTLTNLDLTDVLPNSMQYLGVTAASIGGSAATPAAQATPGTAAPGGTLTRRFAGVTGTAGADDASLTFRYFIPLADGSANAIVNPTTGAAGTSTENSQASATWAAAGTSNPPVTVPSNPASHVLADRSIATQETVSDVTDLGTPGPTPGDTLQYTVNFQVSDYFALKNLLLTDLISDGQHLDPSFVPTLLFTGDSAPLPAAAFAGANYTVTPNYTGANPAPTSPDGTTTVAFRVSDELATRGRDGRVLGGLVPAGGGAIEAAPGAGPTTGTIVFRTIIQDRFTDTYPSGESHVDHGDILTSGVTAQGGVLAVADLAPTGNTAADTSGAGETIVIGSPAVSIYAVNGNTSLPNPVKVKAGDAVTYRLQYTLPASDEEQLIVYDYLPLPIFPVPAGMTFTAVGAGGEAVIPAAGSANFGPADTFYGRSDVSPTVTTNASANSLGFAYPAYADPANTPSTIDLLFTVTASDQPFADGLFLTNQQHVSEGTTDASPNVQDAIVPLLVSEPALTITKGVVAVNDAVDTFSPGTAGPVAFTAPGTAGNRFAGTITAAGLATHPIASSVNRVQANDLVTFAVVLQNTGSGPLGAFNVSLKDLIPTGFAVPAGGAGLNLSITDGTGATLAYTDLGGGLFGGGLELIDPNATAGAVAPYSASSGQNVVVITYDLVATQAVSPSQAIKNTATLTNYASQPGGPNFAAALPTASATANTAVPKLAEVLTTTSLPNTTGANLAIGEVGTYTATITVPEETIANARFVDSLPAGLAIVGIDSVTLGANLTATAQTLTVGTNGSTAKVNFGTIINADAAVGGSDTITVVFRVVALDVAGNRQGTTLPDGPSFLYTGGSATATPVTVVAAVPAIRVTKSVDRPNAQAGDTVTYTVILQHATGSGADAYNLALSDALPAGVTYVGDSLSASTTFTGGTTAHTVAESDGTITATFGTFSIGSTCTLTFQGTVGYNVAGLAPVTNTANVTYTSLPDSSDAQVTTNNAAAYERTGNPANPGGSANNLSGTASATFTPPLTLGKVITGFDRAFLGGYDVAIGERVHYQVTITVPQGTTPGATVTDMLPPGLAIASLDGITHSSPALATSIAGGFAQVLANTQAALPAGGGSAAFDFGTLTNSDSDSETPKTITLTYTVVVLNTLANQAGTALVNSATFTDQAGSAGASAPAVTVRTPSLTVTTTPSAPSGDAGGPPITFTVTVAHAPGSSAEAFNVDLTDLLPAGFTLVPGSLQSTGELAPTSLSASGGQVAATFAAFPLAETATLTFRAAINAGTTPGQSLGDFAGITYTSLPEATDAPIAATNGAAYERTGHFTDPGGSANDLDATGTAAVTVNSNSLAGYVYDDQGDTGTPEDGDKAIAGVSVTLSGTDNLGNPLDETTATAADGTYAFTSLRPGTYAITEALPAGYLVGHSQAGTPFGGAAATGVAIAGIGVPLGTNAPGAGYDFGVLRPAAVAGTVFSDANDDGIQQGGEPGIPGVAVTLTGLDDLGHYVNVGTTTDAAGGFDFAGLRPGTYTIAETQPPNDLDGKDSAGDLDGALTNDAVGNFTLGEGQSAGGVTFGELAPASLSGSVYHDANDNGHRDGDESGVANVIVTLTGTDDLGRAVNVVTATGSDGTYSFPGLRPSAANGYTITETPPAGFFAGRQAIGTPGGNAAVAGRFSGIALTPGVAGTNNDFGELIPASLAGFVYVDANRDGSKDGAEAGLGGVTLTLTGLDDQEQPVHQVTTTAGTGAYTFSGLRPGTYAIAVGQPSGYLPGQVTAGTPAGSTAAPGLIGGITLASGVAGAGNNFGELPTADLSVTQAIDDATPNFGQVVTFTVTLANAGPSTATNVALADTLPPGLTLVSATPSQGSYAGGSWTVGTVAPGSAPTLTLIARVASPNPATNVATIVASDQADPTAPDNTASVTETPQVADLGVTMTLSDPTPNVGEAITYTVTLTDHGPDAASGVTVLDYLPSGLDLVSASPGQGTYDPASGNWTVGALAAGSATTLTLVARVTAPVEQENGAVITHADQFDPNSPNGIAFATDTPQVADLAVGVAVSDPTPNVGAVITYTVTLADLGPDDATGVAVADLLPAGLALVSAAPSQGTYDSATGNWSVGSVFAEGPAPTLTITARVVGPQTRVDGATIAAADQFDPNLENNAATAPETPRQADLALTQTVSNPTPPPGGVIALTLTLANAGPDDATGVSVADLLPAGLAFVSASPAQGTYDPATGSWAVGTLPAGTATTLQILAEVTGAGIKVNTAQVATSDEYDPDSTPGDGNPAEDDQATAVVTPTSTLAGTVYVDANRDGLRQPGEVGIGGVRLTLTGVDAQGHPVDQVMATAPDGTYAFPGLLPGTYSLAESAPVAYNDGRAAAGPGGGVAGRDVIADIPLTAGIVSPGYNFGAIGAAISGRVAADDASDCGCGAGTDGLGGVTITLEDGEGVTVATTTTAGDGSYGFANLPAGPYRIVESPPLGYGLGTPPAIAANLTTSGLADQNFAATTARLAGSVYVDGNDDGLKQPGEAGVAGVAVTLTGVDAAGAPVSRTTATAPDGSYSFAGLLAGSYTIAEAAPAGYLAGKVAVGVPGGTIGVGQTSGIALGGGGVGAGYDFGELVPVSVAGTAYADANDDGIKQAGELGLAGVALTLTGVDDLGHPVTASATTAAGGSYQFAGLRPGTYAIAAATPTGDLAGSAAAGTLGGTPAVAMIAGVAAASGAAGTGYNFGALAPASISGRVFLDANDDGVRQSGEAGVPGVAVTLTGTDDLGHAVALTTTTGPDGTYAFPGRRPGSYAVARAVPAGDLAGKSLSACGCGGGMVAAATVTGLVADPGCDLASPDFPLVAAATLAGSVYVDANDDGARQAGEAGLAGIALTLTGVDDLGHAVALATTTAVDGSYAFAGLRPGTYAIAEAPPAGYLAGTVAAGSLGGVAGPGRVAAIVAGPGSSGGGYDFAALAPGTIAGSVYADANDDGIRQAGEAGLGEVAVTLTGTDDLGHAIRLATTTARDGSYAFAGLRPGTYTLTESAPAGFLDGTATPGTAGGRAGDRTIAGITTTESTVAVRNDFAALAPASLAGTAFLDRNGDGHRAAGEPGMAGVPLTLTGTDDRGRVVVVRSRTGSNGAFAFGGLRPGVYALAGADSAGYAVGLATAGTAGGAGTPGAVVGIRLAAGAAGAGYAFPEHGSTISGNAFADAKGTGTYQAGDAKLGGITVQLRDARGKVLATTTTAADGSYRFAGIPAGEYTVFIARGAGAGMGKPVVVRPGIPDSTSFGVPVAVAQVAGVAFIDRNDDGVREAGEPGARGVPITLSGVDDQGHRVDRSTATAADGSYRFRGLSAGSYSVAEGTAAGLLGGKPGPAGALRVAAGATVVGPSFSQLAPASLSGSVYLDGNHDGTRDPNDFGIARVVVTLAGVDDRGRAVAASTVTADDGRYQFAGLRPGTYSLTESEPSVFFASGSPDGGRYQGPALRSGSAAAGYDFGELARPACRLNSPRIQALLRVGPHPLGAPAGFALAPTAATARAYPIISYWLPTLAARLGARPSA